MYAIRSYYAVKRVEVDDFGVGGLLFDQLRLGEVENVVSYNFV